MITAVIYDMDGVIVNSVPFGKRAEREIFGSYGITITEDMYMDTMGMREDETIAYWCHKYNWPQVDQAKALKEYKALYIKAVRESAALLPGVRESLEFFRAKGYVLALASSSYEDQIDAVLEKFDLRQYFKIVHSGADEAHGKPAPDVYLSTARKIGIAPENCMAIEDSFNGLMAAKSAGMKCLCVANGDSAKFRELGADYVVHSLYTALSYASLR